MKKLLFLVTMLISVNANAVTYLNLYVNGEQANTMIQGDWMTWEFDVAADGNTVICELYLDDDMNQTLGENDILVGRFTLSDGGPGGDGPSDSSSVPDGIVYIQFGQFGFAPEDYLIRVIDNDNTEQVQWLKINPMANVIASVSGLLLFENMMLPDERIENIMVLAMGDSGLFSGLTNADGGYNINLPVAGANWYIDLPFDVNISGYVPPSDGYFLTIPAGATTNIDFYFTKAKAYVYGQLMDETGAPIEIDGWARLEGNQTSSEVNVVNGQYTIPVPLPSGQSSGEFNLNIDSDMFAPEYLRPNPVGPITVSEGDSIEINMVAYSTDSKIYGIITQNNQTPDREYAFDLSCMQYGYTRAVSSAETGFFSVDVRSGDVYDIMLNNNPDWGTPLPDGYIIEFGNYRQASPGDTVYFNMIPSGNLLSGNLGFDEGDPVNFDRWNFMINVQDTNWNWYGVNPENDGSYALPVPDGTYEINLWNSDNQYLPYPAAITGVTVAQDTISDLNFTLNYAHAVIQIKIIDGPIPPWYTWYDVHTTGEWPNIYQTSGEFNQIDSTITLHVCEGSWNLSAPFYDPNYVVSLEDTLIEITEVDSFYYVEYRYQNISGINKTAEVPQKYYLDQNYPNPFNPETTIRYGLPVSGNVKITVYNMLGEKTDILVDKMQTAGKYEVKWHSGNRASGVYFYQIQVGRYNQIQKMILIK